MKDLRLELRWSAQDPLAQLLAGIPVGSRSKVVRAILEAALLPGGWARLDGARVVPTGAGSVAGAASPDTPPSPDGMTTQGRQGLLAGLRQFGALDD